MAVALAVAAAGAAAEDEDAAATAAAAAADDDDDDDGDRDGDRDDADEMPMRPDRISGMIRHLWLLLQTPKRQCFQLTESGLHMNGLACIANSFLASSLTTTQRPEQNSVTSSLCLCVPFKRHAEPQGLESDCCAWWTYDLLGDHWFPVASDSSSKAPKCSSNRTNTSNSIWCLSARTASFMQPTLSTLLFCVASCAVVC